jgi:hypothetical protein
MYKLTQQLKQQLEQQGVKFIEITLEDLAKAKPIYKQKDGNQIPNIQTADPGTDE